MSGLSAWLMAYPILLERIKSNMGAAIGILVCDKSSGHRPLLAELGRPGRSTRRPSADKVARHSETRSEEHTSELQSLRRSSYAVFCLTNNIIHHRHYTQLIIT